MFLFGCFLTISALQLHLGRGYVNLAVGKQAHQQTNYYPSKWLAVAAIDGDRTQEVISGSCALAAPRNTSTWRVDLGRILSIHHIDIYYRFEKLNDWEQVFRWRFAGFFLYISNTTNIEDGYLCFHEIHTSASPPTPLMNIECIYHGRFVIVYNERNSQITYPPVYSDYVFNELCEVEVYGCDIPGYYGQNCVISCPDNCKDQNCEIVNGSCLSCEDGYIGQFCEQPCEPFSYGPQCGLSCRNCFGGLSCDHVNGTCPKGCATGWQENTCNTKCEETFYGENCLLNCSSNCVNRTCDAKTGVCDKFIIKEKQDSDNPTDTASVVAGSVTAIVLCTLVIAGLVLLHRFRKQKKETKLHESKETENLQLKTDLQPNNITNEYANLTSEDIKPDMKQEAELEARSTYDLDYEQEDNVYANNIAANGTFPDILLSQLEDIIKERRRNGNEPFISEYSSLSSGEMSPCVEGRKQHNLKKNRFKATFPYDHSRVILETDHDQNVDYINANFIDGAEREKEYIAAQGPKQNTIEDFWKMVWQENVSQVVMLTNLREGTKLKCAQYWPDLKQDLGTGDFKISNTEEKLYSNYLIRNLNLSHKKAKKTRAIIQYHFTEWPDHSIPEPLCLVRFHNQVTRTITDNEAPTVVHCSAGIGRSGTYIALDALYNMGRSTGKINVVKFVETMRKNRMNMVETLDQYITVYLALCETLKAPMECIKLVDFVDHFKQLSIDNSSNKSKLHIEFKTLLQIRPTYQENDFKIAIQSSGQQRYGSILPLDKYCLHLLTSVPHRGSYINAIRIPSFRNPKQFIITPYPTQDTAVDFLRLLIDHGSTTVVVMEPINDVVWSDVWCPDWSTKSKTVQPFVIDQVSDSVDGNIRINTVRLRNVKVDDSAVIVTIVEPQSKIVDSSSHIITGTVRELVTSILNSSPENPVTVMSRDVASFCGVFCTVYSALEQASQDEEVDIFTIVRQLQNRRPELCSTVEEYEACYQTIADHIEYSSEHLYSNS